MKRSITINWAWIVAYLLLAAILGLNIYQTYNKTEARSITVEGTATIKAEPDSFVFYPQFEIKNTDSAKVKETLTAKSNEVVSKLKALGVKDNQIKLDASQYENYQPA
ncbi:MAG TPA: SIMPL domain-containing protein, partial [Candidatus Polarisedimenticolaceae bacterium]|nr:SIMPL domain-containing protein [Candidatus Polarisedimenticolaceae bacterium]